MPVGPVGRTLCKRYEVCISWFLPFFDGFQVFMSFIVVFLVFFPGVSRVPVVFSSFDIQVSLYSWYSVSQNLVMAF